MFIIVQSIFLFREINDLIFTRGLQLAKLQAQRTLRTCAHVLSTKTLKTFKNFRLAVLSSFSSLSPSYQRDRQISVGEKSMSNGKISYFNSLLLEDWENESLWWNHPVPLYTLASFICETQKVCFSF